MNFTELTTDVLATIRLTRLVLDDKITEPPREKVFQALINTGEKYPKFRKVTDAGEYLLSCPWCVSVYTAAAVFGLRKVAPHTADLVNGALAASLTTGIAYKYVSE